jgi:hypothetical protein
MQTTTGIGLADVQGVYAGAEGELWELVMGEQIHIGGLTSSTALADRAGIAEDSEGVDTLGVARVYGTPEWSS